MIERSPLLTILCITKGEPHADRFLQTMYDTALALPFEAELVVAHDPTHPELDPLPLPALRPRDQRFNRVLVDGRGFLESILELALGFCAGEYILRLDDDERMNEPMWQWLYAERFREQDHWKFDRAHLWQDEHRYIAQGPLWPDHQTRLSIKAKAGGRKTIHAGSPHGGGTLAPGCVIEHHVFLVRTREEREAKLARYNQIHPGAGWPIFHTPEIFTLATKPYSSARHPDEQP